MSRLVFDIETNGLLDELTKIHCLGIRDVDTGEQWSHTPDDILAGLLRLREADLLIGHNIIGFDIPAIAKVSPEFDFSKKDVYDTLMASRLMYPDIRTSDWDNIKAGKVHPPELAGSHNLRSWGYRLGNNKGDYEGGWDTWSPEMQEYMDQDVALNADLFAWFEAKGYSQQAIELEMDVAKICSAQERHGWEFDVDSAVKLMVRLRERQEFLRDELTSLFPPLAIKNGPPKAYKKTMTVKGQRRQKGAVYQPVKFVTFNPGSRDHIAYCLKRKYRWTSTQKTDTGKAKIDENVLGKLKYPEAEALVEYLMVGKVLGQLADGPKAWLGLEKNGKIHGYVNTNGAATGRMTHSSPNVSQVPSTRKPYGKECRQLFTAPDDYLIVGADVSGLELRMLAHYMWSYDGGAYAKVVLDGDVHTFNQEAAGLPTRDLAKTFIYAYIYGAGDIKLGSIVRPNMSKKMQRLAGMDLRRRFELTLPALAKLRKDVLATFKVRGYLTGLDGRLMYCRSEHSALNMLLQGAGAIVCKQWMVFADHMITSDNWCNTPGGAQQVGTIHDELQFQVQEPLADYVGAKLVDAIALAGDHLGIRVPLTGEYKKGKSWAETH